MKLEVYGDISGTRVHVGAIETAGGLEEKFAYDPLFMDSHPGAALSLALPFQEEPFGARQTRAFFRNLLPEGDALAAVARELEVKSSSYLKILKALGQECIGAVTIVDGKEPVVTDSGYRNISPNGLQQLVHSNSPSREMARLQVSSKLSLAGAQAKTGMRCIFDDNEIRYAVPYGDAASTHIVKSSTQRFQELNENECCCLELASRCELQVPEVQVEYFPDGLSLLIVQRYDRIVNSTDGQVIGGESVARLHQEDFCQILGNLPEHKYEKPGQRYIQQVGAAIVRYSDNPVKDLADFVRLLALDTIVGNCDGHIKNIGLLRSPNWTRCHLTPVYDIASTVVYEGLDRTMAMHMGSTNKIDQVERTDFLALAEDLRISRRAVAQNLDQTIDAAERNVGELIERAEERASRHLVKLEQMASSVHRSCTRLSK